MNISGSSSFFESIKSYIVNNYIITEAKLNKKNEDEKTENIKEEKEKAEVEFNLCYKAPYGDYMISYKDTKIHIIHNYIDKIIGTRKEYYKVDGEHFDALLLRYKPIL